MSKKRKYDLIIWGATGFTGRLVAEYIFKQYGTNGDLKWAVAARNHEKLEKIRAEVADNSVPMIIADSMDEASLGSMVQQTKVICTTVGPYAKYGSKLLAACVAHQTDYCDLTGEVQWMRRMIDTHHATAAANGTKIVHTCGVDSIPSDIGVHFVQQAAMERTGQPAQWIRMRVAGFSGGISGGTYVSLNNVMAEAAKDKVVYKVLNNPYGLNPQGEQSGSDQRDLSTVKYEKATDLWIYPFIMAGINTKVVRRSNALQNYPYGKDFRYDEAMIGGEGMSGRIKSYIAGGVLGILFTGKEGSLQKQLVNRLLPKPGEGPSKSTRENGYYKFKFFTTLFDGSEMLGIVTGDRDPGYGSTSKMLAESAICLAKDELSEVGGVLTPAVAMGDALLKRLQNHAGLTFSIAN